MATERQPSDAAPELPAEWVEFASAHRLRPKRTAELAHLGLPLRVVSSYFSQGVTDPAEIDGWFSAGISSRAAAQLSAAGFTPEQGLGWLRSGFTAEEAASAGADGSPADQPNPRADARWTDAFTRTRGPEQEFAIRRTELGDVARAVVDSLEVPGTRRSSMFSTAYAERWFLDGGWNSKDGYGFASVSGEWITGYRALRFVCARMGLRGPRRLKGESTVPTPSELEADYQEQRMRAWTPHLMWAESLRTDVPISDQDQLAGAGVTPEEWDEWSGLDFAPEQVVALSDRGLDWSRRLLALGLSPPAIAAVAVHDLDPEVTLEFVELGVRADAVWKFVEAEMTPDDLRLFLRAGLPAAIAREWFRAGFDGSNAERWSQFGLLPRECARLRSAGVEPNLADVEAQYLGEIERGSNAAYLMLGSALLAADRPAEAVDPLRRAAGAGLMAHGLLGEAYFRLERLDDAVSSWQTSADAHDSWAMMRLGMIHEQQGQVDEAEAWYLRGAQANGTEAMVRLGRLIGDLGRPSEAEKWLVRAADLEDPDAETALAALLRSQGGEKDALEWDTNFKGG